MAAFGERLALFYPLPRLRALLPPRLTERGRKCTVWAGCEENMTTIPASEACHRLDQLINETAETHNPVTITGGRHDAVLISATDWASIQGTLRLFPAPAEREFIARGLASRDEARRTGEYVDSDDVLNELDAMLANGRAKPAE
jgi:antitoxin YefM